MKVKEEVGTIADEEASAPLDPVLVQWLEFVEELRDVDDGPVAQEVGRVRVDEAAGQQVERVLLAVDDHGVPRVGAAVEAGHDVVILGKDISELALALIAPLPAEDGAHLGVAAAHVAGGSGGGEAALGHHALRDLHPAWDLRSRAQQRGRTSGNTSHCRGGKRSRAGPERSLRGKVLPGGALEFFVAYPTKPSDCTARHVLNS